jgi:predicted Zn-dependent protease
VQEERLILVQAAMEGDMRRRLSGNSWRTTLVLVSCGLTSVVFAAEPAKTETRKLIEVATERAATAPATTPPAYLKDYAGGEVAPEIAVYLDQDSHFVTDPSLEAYLGGITDRLLKSWTGPKPSFKLMIKSSGERCAFSDLGGLLVVCTELLRAVESEDELAAVLGHEIGHILLGHTRDEATRHNLPGGIQTTALLAAAAQQKSANGTVNLQALTPDARKTMETAGTLNLLWQDMFAPSWNRNQERDADRLGLDLMLGAGYDRAAFVSLFDKLASTQAQRSERMEAVRQQALQRFNVQQTSTKPATAGDIGSVLQNALKQTAVDTAFSWLTSFNTEYEPRDVRLASLSEYADQHYTGRRSKVSYTERFSTSLRSGSASQLLGADTQALEISAALAKRDVRGAATHAAAIQLNEGADQPHVRLALARATFALGKRPEATAILAGAVERPLASGDTYREFADMLKVQRQPDQARGVLELGAKRIGNYSSFLPDLVEVSRGGTEKTVAEDYAIRCDQEDKRQGGLQSLGLGSTAAAAATPTLYKECVRRLGYDPIARREAEAKRKQQQQIQAPADALNKALGDFFKKAK